MGLLDSLSNKVINHRNLYLLGLSSLLAGIGWSNFLMSLGLYILLGNWIIEFNYKQKWKTVKSNKALLILISILFLHLIGLIWTTDFAYANKDIIGKTPLLLFPLIIGTTKKLDKHEVKTLFLIYISSIFILSLFSLAKLLGYFGEPISDKRNLSILISHIRYGLNIAFSVFIIFYYFHHFSKFIKALLAPIAIWFILSLFYFELTTGLICLILASLLVAYFRIYSNKTKPFIKVLISIFSIGFIAFSINSIYNVKEDFYETKSISYDQEEYLSHTENGNLYYHDYNSQLSVNGVFIWRYVSAIELEKEWNKKSSIPFSETDRKGNEILHTLVRFMSSKGLMKDSSNFQHLTDSDIKAIEKGIAHAYYFDHNPIQNRIHKTLYEYDNYTRFGQVNGFSLAMRVEYWKNTWNIIMDNFWLGVGTGDIKEEIKNQYEKDNSKLENQYRKRTHNQYLSIWGALGFIGLVWFLLYLILPIYWVEPSLRKFYLVFWLIVCLSFITEDTLETQAGVSFFSLFNSLILLGFPPKKQ